MFLAIVIRTATHIIFHNDIYNFQQRSSSIIYKDMWNNSVQHKENLVTNHGQGLERVARENYIYLGRAGRSGTRRL